MPGIFRMVAVALTASSVGFLRAADISPPSDSPSHTLSPNLSRQLSGLDSDDFATRQIALAGVEAVLKTPHSRGVGREPVAASTLANAFV